MTRWMAMFPVRETVSEAHGMSESPGRRKGLVQRAAIMKSGVANGISLFTAAII